MGREVGICTERPLLQRQYQTRLFAVVSALILVFTPLRTEAAVTYKTEQLDALQALWAEWNLSNPDLANNLAGWSSSQRIPCRQQDDDDTTSSWRGVQCLENINCTGNGSDCDGYIIGLTLDNASIGGRLPPAIGDINTLSRLVLTRNPKLTGPLPQEIQKLFLQTLDLHENGFSGTLPDMPGLYTVLNVDLSGNNFSGEFVPQIRKWTSLETLNLAYNEYLGRDLAQKEIYDGYLGFGAFGKIIPTDAFVNMTQLESLDLTRTSLGGALPDLSKCKRLQSLKLSGNRFNGSLPDLNMFPSLKTLNLSGNIYLDEVEFPFASFINASVVNSSLSVLDLSSNYVNGSVTNWAGSDDLKSLEELYLDGTFIDGVLDVNKLIESGLVRVKKYEEFGGFLRVTKSPGLRVLSMEYSQITGVNFDGDLYYINTIIRLQGTRYCDKITDAKTRCFCQQYCSSEDVLSNKKVIKIAAGTSVAFVIVVIAVVVAGLLYRARRYEQYLLLQVSKKFEEFDVKPTIYPYNELRAATRDFHPDTKLGEGGYGAVYKGTLPNQSMVAVKQLFVKNSQGMDDFLNEVVLITGMKHRNLVNLKGCCLREHQRMLVYEYVDNYDIDQILLRGEHRTSLSWTLRHNICLGVARGLHYLHSLARPKIIHRDVKASNVLLDKNFEPKIADFGLALLFPDEQSHIMTVHVAGTKGYLAPEYASLGQLSEKVDVYSFGTLCLEVLSGRPNIDESMPVDEIYLSKWAWKLHGEGKLMNLVDKSMTLSEDEKQEVRKVINIALLCSQDAAEQRPTMARVVAMLQHDTDGEVVVSNSGKKEQQLDTLQLLGLTTVSETDEAETSSFYARADGDAMITVEETLELNKMRAR